MQDFIKALLINASCEAAAASVGPLTEHAGKPLTIDPLIQDVGLQQKNLLVYEASKIFYHALLRAFQDKTGVWPDPKVTAGGVEAPGVNVLVQALKRARPDTPIGTVAGLLTLLTQAAGAVLPSIPGQELTPQPEAK